MIAVIGLAVWLAGLVTLPAPLAARITLAAPLILVPHLLAEHPLGDWVRRLGGPIALLAALPLLVAFALPAGPLAAAFTLPWLALALVGAGGAAWHGIRLLPGLLHPRRAAELGLYAGLGFLGVGAAFLVVDRLGIRPLGFGTEIILLTGTHFHFAGFGLLTIACLLAADRPALRPAVVGLVIGIGVTALGFIFATDGLAAVGALLVGAAGLGPAVALLTSGQGERLRSMAQRIAGLFLLVGLPMGIAWSWSIWLGFAFLDLELMVRTHGALNASAVLLAAFTVRGGDR